MEVKTQYTTHGCPMIARVEKSVGKGALECVTARVGEIASFM